MKSNAATWAGDGVPPPLTAGDVATMAAPRPGFDPSLHHSGASGIESNHTTKTAAAENALDKARADGKGAADNIAAIAAAGPAPAVAPAPAAKEGAAAAGAPAAAAAPAAPAAPAAKAF